MLVFIDHAYLWNIWRKCSLIMGNQPPAGIGTILELHLNVELLLPLVCGLAHFCILTHSPFPQPRELVKNYLFLLQSPQLCISCISFSFFFKRVDCEGYVWESLLKLISFLDQKKRLQHYTGRVPQIFSMLWFHYLISLLFALNHIAARIPT